MNNKCRACGAPVDGDVCDERCADRLVKEQRVEARRICESATRDATLEKRLRMAVMRLLDELSEVEQELDLWQHCANCHERMDAPGHCSRAESEGEAGYRAMWEQQMERAEKAEAILVERTKERDEAIARALTSERFRREDAADHLDDQAMHVQRWQKAEATLARVREALRRLIAPCPYCANALCQCDHKWGDSCRCCANGAESPALIAVRAALTPAAPETQPEPSHVNQAARLEQPR
jgi:hypothetical protein